MGLALFFSKDPNLEKLLPVLQNIGQGFFRTIYTFDLFRFDTSSSLGYTHPIKLPRMILERRAFYENRCSEELFLVGFSIHFLGRDSDGTKRQGP